ncbi:MAG: copper transporter [Acidimicrobiia bacterium]
MINFRFHLVSLIAIFLALALGVVIGAGVIDRGVVDALDNRLNRVEAKADQTQAENDRLHGQINENDGAIGALAKPAVASLFMNADVGLVAVRGVDGKRVSIATTSLQDAGARVTGVLWLERGWKLDTEAEITAMAKAIGSSSRRPVTLRTQAWQQLAARLAEPPSLTSQTATDDVLHSLDAAGFVTFDAPSTGGGVTQFPGAAASIVLVVGTEGDVPSSDVVMPAATAIGAEQMPLVVGDVYAQDAPDTGSRGSAFSDLRNSTLSTTVSTVDDLERPQGPATVALALAGLLRIPAIVGHFGLGDDAVLLPDLSAS